MFQYKILHDVVFTEKKLFRSNIAKSDLCYLCSETKQDLKHMLLSCQFVSEFWEAFLYWYKSHVSIGLELSTINILYGIIDNNHLNKLTNHLLLPAKYYIYCCIITEEPLLFSVYLTIRVNKAVIEKQIAVSVNSPKYYYNKQKPLIEKKFVRQLYLIQLVRLIYSTLDSHFIVLLQQDCNTMYRNLL